MKKTAILGCLIVLLAIFSGCSKECDRGTESGNSQVNGECKVSAIHRSSFRILLDNPNSEQRVTSCIIGFRVPVDKLDIHFSPQLTIDYHILHSPGMSSATLTFGTPGIGKGVFANVAATSAESIPTDKITVFFFVTGDFVMNPQILSAGKEPAMVETKESEEKSDVKKVAKEEKSEQNKHVFDKVESKGSKKSSEPYVTTYSVKAPLFFKEKGKGIFSCTGYIYKASKPLEKVEVTFSTKIEGAVTVKYDKSSNTVSISFPANCGINDETVLTIKTYSEYPNPTLTLQGITFTGGTPDAQNSAVQ